MNNILNYQELKNIVDKEYKKLVKKYKIKALAQTEYLVFDYWSLLFLDEFENLGNETFTQLSILGRLYKQFIMGTNSSTPDNGYQEVMMSWSSISRVENLLLNGSYSTPLFDKYYKSVITDVFDSLRMFNGNNNSFILRELKNVHIMLDKMKLMNIIPLALSISGSSPAKITSLQRSVTNFIRAYYFYSNVINWQKDLSKGDMTYLLANFFYNHRAEISPEADLELIKPEIFRSDILLDCLELAERYLLKAEKHLTGHNLLMWRDLLQKYLAKVRSLSRDLKAIKENRAEQSGSAAKEAINPPSKKITVSHLFKAERLTGSIERAIKFIKEQQSSQGYWEDFNLSVGYSNEWVTGYVGSILNQVCTFYSYDNSFLASSAEWLLSKEHIDGGWGYNYKSGADADSTVSCLSFLHSMGINKGKLEKSLDFLKSHKRDDDGFGTFSLAEIKQERENLNLYFCYPISMYKGWTSSDPQITANIYNFISDYSCNDSEELLEKGLQYILKMQHRKGHWNAYWYNSKVISTFHCLEMVINSSSSPKKAVNRSFNFFKRELNKAAKLSYKPYSFFDLAYLLLIFTQYKELEYIKPKSSLEQKVIGLLNILIDNQDSDGSWPGEDIMRIPFPWDDSIVFNDTTLPTQQDDKRLFTTATVIKGLAYYYNALSPQEPIC